MTTTPSKLAFRLYFRNKIQTRKCLNRDSRLQQLLKKHFKTLFSELAIKSCLVYGKNKTLIGLNGYSYKSLGYKIKRKVLTTGNYLKENKPFFFSAGFLPVYLGKTKIKNILKNSSVARIETANNLNLKKPNIPKLVLQLSNLFLKKNPRVLSRSNSKLGESRLLFGDWGICFEQYGLVSSNYVETVRLDVAKILRKKGRVWIRICCDTPVSAKPAETRMGKGKGLIINYWAAKVHPGQLFFEFSGVTKMQFKQIYQKLCQKSAISLKMVH